MILDRLRDYIEATPLEADGRPQTHLARFPSPEWNLKSWSHRLVEDLRLKHALYRSRLAEGLRWKLALAERLTTNAFSYHDDAEYKALLFSALRRRPRSGNEIVVLPEVGPFGFDLLMARCAGFRRFVAYDRERQIVDACRTFHEGVDVEYVVSSSADFELARFASADHLIIFPDWPHDQLERRLAGFANVLRYSFRGGKQRLTDVQRRLGIRRLDWDGLFAALDRLA